LRRPVIVVHGGAGNWPREKQPRGLKGVRTAAAIGFRELQHHRSAVDAVESAVMSMEDNPVFNAGTGSTLNLLGEVEMDAAIVDGSRLEVGAVALVRGVKNPVRLARIVMEKTDHALIAGYGAERIAAAFGLPTTDLEVKDKLSSWKRAMKRLRDGKSGRFAKNLRLVKAKFPFEIGDTVGALALDRNGDLAAACSTGGVLLKLPGRIGDSAIMGAGLYADSRIGAATATGIGELAIRSVLSKTTVEMMKTATVREACVDALGTVRRKIGKGIGLLALDRQGDFGVAHDTTHLCWAAVSRDSSEAGVTGLRL
jgi:L-asparaginase / beta-aspartyl-peptidase